MSNATIVRSMKSVDGGGGAGLILVIRQLSSPAASLILGIQTQ